MKFAKLRGRIKEVYIYEKHFQEAMGFSSTTKTKKLNGEVEFTLDELKKMVSILAIPLEEVASYFFT